MLSRSTSALVLLALACTDGADDAGTTPTGGDTGAETASPEETGTDTGTPVTTPGDVVELTVDASDREAFAYVDLDTATVLGSDAASGTDWDLAIRRFEIRTNGGTSGPGDVMAGLAVDADDYYDESGDPIVKAFVHADPDAELPHLTADLEDPDLGSDTIVGVFGEDWFVYDFATGVISANPDVGWLVRGGEGTSFARVRTSELDFPTRKGNGIESFSVAVEVEGAGGLAAPVFFEGAVPASGGEVCYDWDTATNVACTGAAWDLMLGFSGRSTFLYTNSGDVGDGDGGALGAYPWKDLQAYTKASETPGGDDLSPHFRADVSESVFTTASWYAYDLQGQFLLYPNFRTYAVQIGEGGARYAVQVVGYYDASEVSGHVSLRWVEQ